MGCLYRPNPPIKLLNDFGNHGVWPSAIKELSLCAMEQRGEEGDWSSLRHAMTIIYDEIN